MSYKSLLFHGCDTGSIAVRDAYTFSLKSLSLSSAGLLVAFALVEKHLAKGTYRLLLAKLSVILRVLVA